MEGLEPFEGISSPEGHVEIAFLLLEGPYVTADKDERPTLTINAISCSPNGPLVQAVFQYPANSMSDSGDHDALVAPWLGSRRKHALSAAIIDEEEDDIDDFVVPDAFVPVSRRALLQHHQTISLARKAGDRDWSWIFDNVAGSTPNLSLGHDLARIEETYLSTERHGRMLLSEVIGESHVADVDEDSVYLQEWRERMQAERPELTFREILMEGSAMSATYTRNWSALSSHRCLATSRRKCGTRLSVWRGRSPKNWLCQQQLSSTYQYQHGFQVISTSL